MRTRDYFWLILRTILPAGAAFLAVHTGVEMWGILAIIGFLYFSERDGARFLIRQFGLPDNWTARSLGLFMAITLLSGIGGALLFFIGYFNPLIIAVAFVLTSILLRGLLFFKISKTAITENKACEEKFILRKPVYLIVIWLFFYIAAFITLAVHQSADRLVTPWQAISSYYIYLFFASTITLALIIFSKTKTRVVLFLICLQVFLLASYLPLSHELIYGADGWRHSANIERAVAGQGFLAPSVIGGLPKVDFGLLSYSSFWALGGLWKALTGIGALEFLRWLMPILWSFVFPILIYEISRSFGVGRRTALVASFTSMVPFALQAASSFALPVSFGLLALAFGVMLLSHSRMNRVGRIFLGIWGLALFFNYSLDFVLYILVWLGMELILYLSRKNIFSIYYYILGILLAVVLPVLEYASGYLTLSAKISWFSGIKQIFGSLSGWYLASGPRPHDILAGNILFNQTPTYAFTSNLFIFWRYYLVVVAVIFFGASFYGFYILIKRAGKNTIIGLLGFGLFVSYLCRYFLSGEMVLLRRLDGVLAFLLIVGLAVVWQKLIAGKNRLGLTILCVFAVIITASYSLGPDSEALSLDEYQAMAYIAQMETKQEKSCVLADTLSLLSLEKLSQKKIIGGGWPINNYFAQPEKEKALSEFINFPSESVLNYAVNTTLADHCWFIIREENPTLARLVELNSIVNGKKFGKISVWLYNIKK